MNTPLPEKQKLTDFSEEEIRDWVEESGEKPFRAKQLYRWFYLNKQNDATRMGNLPKSLKEKLTARFSLERIPIVNKKQGADNTIKFLQRLHDGLEIESVLMRMNGHSTICISTQAGCAIGCKFCLTATMGLKRHLTTGEIVDQVLNGFSLLEEGENLRNIVYMGMGEPFHNYKNTIRSLETFLNPNGFDFSARRVTVSTSGLIPQIEKFAKEKIRPNLAISLNGVTQEARKRLMPISHAYPLEELMKVCREFPRESRKRITFEYILLKDVTDSLESAAELVKLLHGTKSKVNLIPYNNNPQLGFFAPSPERAAEFQRFLLDKGVLATIRISKGRDISAACGQLAVEKAAAV